MDKLRLGVIGVGSVVREIYSNLYFHSEYSSMLDVAAIADPYGQALKAFGEKYGIPEDRRFPSHRDMLDAVALDAVMVNTPDNLHHRPTVDAMNHGLDVLLPKPTADRIRDCHDMMETSRKTGRLMGVDFHKRLDPRIKEAATLFQAGRYGPLQSAVFYMLDKLLVADPNHKPRFFASPDFASVNTPVSFLCVHMADSLLQIIRQKPVRVRATGFKQKLPSLKPIAVDGYDMVDTEIAFDSGALAHVITGWHLPNTAHSVTVQSGRLICRDGMVDLPMDVCGYHEIVDEGIIERNVLFQSREADGTVSGFGMTCPGRFLRQFLAARKGDLDADELRESLLDPFAAGFYTTLVLQGAHESLGAGRQETEGVVAGGPIDLRELLIRELGEDASAQY